MAGSPRGLLPGLHRSVRARFAHTVPQATASLRDGTPSERPRGWQRIPPQQPIEVVPCELAVASAAAQHILQMRCTMTWNEDNAEPLPVTP